MNRQQRRKISKDKNIKAQTKQKFTLLELQKAFAVAQEMKEESRGHLFSRNLKERCVFCGKGRRVRTECDYWFLTYLDRVQTILINPEFFIGADHEAGWIQQGDEYKEIRIPVKVENA